MNETSIENEIQANRLDVAPRVTLAQIDALKERVTYVTEVASGTTSTFVHAFLDGDFYLCTGHSACVSKENFNAEIGIKIAKADAEAQVTKRLWLLEGYALRKKLRGE